MNPSQNKDSIFEKIQEYLKPLPLIIWGSGATIPFGMPSMDELKQELNINDKRNLEEFLSKVTDKTKLDKYQKKIFETINEKDSEFRKGFHEKNDCIKPIDTLISWFYEAHPKKIDIVTTNYDCVLEYIFSYSGKPFSDGFSGREFSSFDKEKFKPKNNINLYKVHGSLRFHNKKYSNHNDMMDAVFPSKDKHKTTHQEPFRTLITKSDEAIEKSECFLSIGFGFNDEHLTPKIKTAVEKGKSIVVIAKKITNTCKEELAKASKCILIEEGEKDNETLFTYRDNNDKQKIKLSKSYWKIENFNEILM